MGLQGLKQIHFKLLNIVTFAEFHRKASMYFAGIYDVFKNGRELY